MLNFERIESMPAVLPGGREPEKIERFLDNVFKKENGQEIFRILSRCKVGEAADRKISFKDMATGFDMTVDLDENGRAVGSLIAIPKQFPGELESFVAYLSGSSEWQASVGNNYFVFEWPAGGADGRADGAERQRLAA